MILPAAMLAALGEPGNSLAFAAAAVYPEGGAALPKDGAYLSRAAGHMPIRRPHPETVCSLQKERSSCCEAIASLVEGR